MLVLLALLANSNKIYAYTVNGINVIYDFLDKFLHFGKDIYVIDINYAIEYWHIELIYFISIIVRVLNWLGQEGQHAWWSDLSAPFELRFLAAIRDYILAKANNFYRRHYNFFNEKIISKFRKLNEKKVWNPFDENNPVYKKINRKKIEAKEIRNQKIKESVILYYADQEPRVMKRRVTWEEVFIDSLK